MIFVVYSAEGRITRQYAVAGVYDLFLSTSIDDLIIKIDQAVKIDDHYIENGELKQKPQRPSEYHEFNYPQKQWTLPVGWLERARQDATDTINLSAGNRIVSLYPDWKQRNMLAESIELLDKKGGRTAEEQSRWDELSGHWAQIKAIRKASNAAVDTVNAAQELDAIFAATEAFARWISASQIK